MFNIVLLEPEKPDNTGNIGRTCVATGSALHLIYPIGFQLTRKNIHHAGLDYWDRLKLFTHDNYNEFLEYYNRARSSKQSCRGEHCEPVLWFATTKGHKSYTDVKFKDDDFIMFGKESAGIPEEILADDEEHCIRIPMKENERSLNLSNSVAIVLYEALRQNSFSGLLAKGELHKLKYNN
jgi:tRNA (cytidine/uridine-2'-O-)-methyltransferase